MKPKYEIFSYCIYNIVAKENISLAIDCFYSKILYSLDKKTKFAILFKVLKEDGILLDISVLQIVDSTQINKLKIIFNEFLFYFGEIKAQKIIFTYSFLHPPFAPLNCVYNPPISYFTNSYLSELYNVLPNNRQFETWGDSLTIYNDIHFLVEDDNLDQFVIWHIENEYHISLSDLDGIICYFKDIYDSNCKSDNTFIRIIGNMELYYYNGECYYINSRNLFDKNKS